ncbi:MAG TPA: redoxin family protein [Bryobacteraceae bacterium]|nr:redoxin family protein [Bryobacteraceae bacterium]
MQSGIAAGLLLAFAAVTSAAVPPHACEADDATFQLLSQWRTASSDARLPFDARIAPLWKAIEAQPDNVFLHHAYQKIFLNYIESVRLGPVDEAYQELMAAHPGDLVLKYAYARLLYGRRTTDSKKMLEEAIAVDPDFPWAHLGLARVYQDRQFRNEARQQQETARFFALCPATLAPEAYEAYKSMPLEFRIKAAAALRERLNHAGEPRELAALPSLWQLEFQGAEAGRDAERARITEDLNRLREPAENDLTLLRAALEGYNLVEDREGARWARNRIASLAPHSFTACDVAMERWFSDQVRPSMEDPRERVQGYYRELLDATDNWIQICPLYEAPWTSRFRAIRELRDEPTEKALQTGEGLLRASEANSSNSFVPPSILVAELYANRGIGFDRIPALVERNQRDSEARLASDHDLDWLPKSWKERNELDAAESAMAGRVLAIRKYLHDGRREEAAKELARAEHDAAASSGDKAMWAVQPHLIAAYLAMGDRVKATAQLKMLKEWLESHQPAETAGRSERLADRARQSKYWELAGEVAELNKRPKDALTAYQDVLQYRSDWGTLAERFAMIDKTAALWKSTGGAPEEWARWINQMTATIAVPARNWNTIDRRFPAFALVDLSGRRWTQDDLKGKITLINMWATWCGPCTAELPYVQKIQNALKDRKDIQVITLNVDDNPGLIEPFLKQRSVTSLTVIPARDFVERTLQINGFPRTWIVDRDGVARREQLGFTGEPAKWAERVLESLK